MQDLCFHTISRLHAPSYFHSFVFKYSPLLSFLNHYKNLTDFVAIPHSTHIQPFSGGSTSWKHRAMSEQLEILKFFVPWDDPSLQFKLVENKEQYGMGNYLKFSNHQGAFFFQMFQSSLTAFPIHHRRIWLWPQRVVRETCKKGRIMSQWKVLCFTDSSPATSLQNQLEISNSHATPPLLKSI